jgi:hypothetical protein
MSDVRQKLLFDDDLIDVNKAVSGFKVEDATFYGANNVALSDRRKRGLSVYNYSALISQAGRDRYGRMQTAEYLLPYFSLTISDRIDMARACGSIFGVVTGRMNTISGLEWKVSRKRKNEDRIAFQLKTAKQMIDERQAKAPSGSAGPLPSPDTFQQPVGPSLASMKQDAQNKIIVRKCKQFLMGELPDLLDDLSNFEKAFTRWSHRIKDKHEDECTAIEEWMKHPNLQDTFEDFTKKLIFDEHVHGLAVPYKRTVRGKIEQIYMLPGGCCFPIHGRHVGDAVGVIQMVDGAEAQLFYGDECSVLQYAPYSGDPYGLVPLEALVNKVAELLLFDERAAQMADGTKPPDKLIAFGENTPWGNLQSEFQMPMNKDEQKRLETVINEWRKEAVRVISGHGTPVVVDVTRADVFKDQSERQRMVREEVGLVFGASNAEMNLSGSESTSGRDSSKTQERKDQNKGIYPHIQIIENFWNHHVFPFRYGEDYEFEFASGVSEQDKIDIWTKMLQSGLYSVNDIRRDEMGLEPYSQEDSQNQFDLPNGAQSQQQSPELGMAGGMGGLGMGDLQ